MKTLNISHPYYGLHIPRDTEEVGASEYLHDAISRSVLDFRHGTESCYHLPFVVDLASATEYVHYAEILHRRNTYLFDVQ